MTQPRLSAFNTSGKKVDDHLKEALDEKQVREFITKLANIKQVRYVEQRYFEIYLKDNRENLSDEPIVKGTYFAGRGKWIRPWLEVSYRPNPVEFELLRLLTTLIPPGGHIMVEYSLAEKVNEKTASALKLGVPPAATSLGHVLWQLGFRAFKDWYFPEGWKEGETKLQGDRPLNKEQEEAMASRVAKELKKFLEQKPDEVYKEWEDARDRAKEILKSHGL